MGELSSGMCLHLAKNKILIIEVRGLKPGKDGDDGGIKSGNSAYAARSLCTSVHALRLSVPYSCL